MKKLIKLTLFMAAIGLTSCDFGNLNDDPDNPKSTPINQQLTSMTVNIGFVAGSDLNRYSSLIMQQYSGQTNGTLSQTQQYESYQISGSDANNVWSSLYATILNDAENIIKEAKTQNSPHYSGVAKILKAYTYQIIVDTWGKVPFTETQQTVNNLKPKYDSDEDIYKGLIKLLDEGISEVSTTTSTLSPGTNSTIFPGSFSVTKNNWIKFANTLKLRIYLHYSEKDATFAKNNIDALISSSVPFFGSNADNFEMNFVNAANAKNPIEQFDTARVNNLVANAKLVNMMNATSDPRRPSYFTQISGAYVGAVSGSTAPVSTFSKFHEYLKGKYTPPAPPAAAFYSGTAPIRMLTFAEYNFIRAEAALRFSSPGSAQAFFQAGITASMQSAGVAATDIATYIAANGTLTGTTAQQLEKIINEKYIASYGVVMEPWSDWRRTGYPTIALPTNAVTTFIPRSLFYPQSEIDLNSQNIQQKPDMKVRVFWDTRL